MLHVVPAGILSFPSGYTITNALMFDATANSLTKSFSGSGNRNTYTRSFWIKRSKLGAQQKIFDTGPDGGNNLEALYFSSTDTLYWTINDSNAVRYNYQTTQVFRDTTAWYHFVCARDTATVKMYVNGDEITDFVGTPTNAGTSNIGRWTHTDQNVIGKYFLSSSDYLGGYLAEVIQVDGSILTPTSFGERDSNGVWVPIEPPASLGTNGFHLDFESTDIGNDAAGSNNWTAVVGTSNVAADSPTDNSSSEVTIHQSWETATSDQAGSWGTPSQELSNTKGGSSSGASYNLGTMSLTSGKWYWRVQITQESSGYPAIGVHKTTATPAYDGGYIAGDTNGWCILTEGTHNGKPRHNGTNGSALHTYSNGDYVDVALDMDNGKIWFGRNGTFDGNPAAGSGEAYSSISGSLVPSMSTSTSSYGIIDTSGGTPPTGFSQYVRTATGVGNHWTLNPLASTDTLTNGNLSFTAAGNFSSYVTAPAIPMSGKWYYEVTATGGDQAIGTSASYDAYLGLVRTDVAIPTGSHDSNDNLWVIANWNPTPSGQKENGSSAGGSYAPTSGFGDGSIIMVAIDMDNNAMWFGNDGTWAGSATASEIAAGTTTNAAFTNSSNNSFGSNQMMPYHGAHSDLATYNFGATAFTYTPPTGFKALNTANLSAPTVTKPSDHFKAIIYEGTGAELSTGDTDVEALSFKPDFVWIKNRDTSDHHMLYDSVREATKDLHPSIEHAETTTAQTLKSFDANGFTLGTDDQVNTNNESYVAWCLKAGGAPTTDNDNTSGAMDDGSVFKSGVVQSSYTPSGSPSNYPKKMSIASHGGFSIVEYVGTGANATVPHGLSRTPTFFMLKPMTQAHGWAGYHSAIGTGSGNDKVIRWDTTTIGDQSGDAWQNNPFANAHTITFGSQTGQNEDTIPHIMYVWAKTPGLIGIGSYTANGSDDGPYVVVDDGASGFRPAWVMTKRIDHSSGDWWITDSVRTTSNPMSKAIYIDAQPEEDADDNRIDFLSNGFKLRDDSSRRNTVVSGSNNFIYLAFAEDPFGGKSIAQARAR
jgi:hypothetical protein